VWDLKGEGGRGQGGGGWDGGGDGGWGMGEERGEEEGEEEEGRRGGAGERCCSSPYPAFKVKGIAWEQKASQ